MYVFLGNHKALRTDRVDGEDVVSNHKGKWRTEVRPAVEAEATADSLFDDITGRGGVWATHAQAGSKPAWVASDDAGLAARLGAFYGCATREPLPEGEKGEHAGSSFAQAILGTVGLMLGMLMLLALRAGLVDLRTNAGTDWLSGIMGNATANPMAYMALTANATAAAAGDTTLTAEIATAGGGLVRKAFTYAHTGGTSTWTATATFTANGSDALPVTVNKIGLFNASSAGTMGFEFVTTAATFAASGDAVTYTYTITP